MMISTTAHLAVLALDPGPELGEICLDLRAALQPPALGVGFGRIVVSEIEVPNMLANLV